MTTPCVQEGRLSEVETHIPHIMRRIDEIKGAVDGLSDKLDEHAKTYAKAADVDALKAKTEKLEHQWIWVTGFAAAVVFVANYAIKFL